MAYIIGLSSLSKVKKLLFFFLSQQEGGGCVFAIFFTPNPKKEISNFIAHSSIIQVLTVIWQYLNSCKPTLHPPPYISQISTSFILLVFALFLPLFTYYNPLLLIILLQLNCLHICLLYQHLFCPNLNSYSFNYHPTRPLLTASINLVLHNLRCLYCFLTSLSNLSSDFHFFLASSVVFFLSSSFLNLG